MKDTERLCVGRGRTLSIFPGDELKKKSLLGKTYATWGRLKCRKKLLIEPSWAFFDAFLADMGACPVRNASIKRINLMLPWSKTNCVWEPWGRASKTSSGKAAGLYKHGHSLSFTENKRRWTKKSKTYETWSKIKKLCKKLFYQHNNCYTEGWDSFLGFLEDMGEKPVGTRFKRYDASFDFCKANCYWTPIKRTKRRKTK